MLGRMVELKEALLTCRDFRGCDVLTPEFFLFLEEILEILKPFELFTKQLSKRSECISSVLPIYYVLMKKLRNDTTHRFSIMQESREKIANGLESRMKEYIDDG